MFSSFGADTGRAAAGRFGSFGGVISRVIEAPSHPGRKSPRDLVCQRAAFGFLLVGAIATVNFINAKSAGLPDAREWEPHAATWLTWPRPDGISFPGKYETIPPVYAELIRLWWKARM